MKHAPHSLLALLTVLGLSESAHGAERKTSAERPDAALFKESEMDEAVRASLEDAQRRQEAQIAEDALLARSYAEREAEAWLRQKAQRAQASSVSLKDERPRQADQIKQDEMLAREIAEREADGWRRQQARMAQAPSVSLKDEPRRQEEQTKRDDISASIFAENAKVPIRKIQDKAVESDRVEKRGQRLAEAVPPAPTLVEKRGPRLAEAVPPELAAAPPEPAIRLGFNSDALMLGKSQLKKAPSSDAHKDLPEKSKNSLKEAPSVDANAALPPHIKRLHKKIRPPKKDADVDEEEWGAAAGSPARKAKKALTVEERREAFKADEDLQKVKREAIRKDIEGDDGPDDDSEFTPD